MDNPQVAGTPAGVKGKASSFKKAERKKAWLKLALTGPSGSGKTYSALLIAKGMGGRIAVIDTENGSASLYADSDGMPDYDVVEIDPPYTTQKYIEKIKEAWDGKYEILIIDSISHAWMGEGGLLQQKEEIDARGTKDSKNKYANWASITKMHEQFKGWLLKADMHMIVTMRSKQDYMLVEGGKVEKLGMAPQQREGMEYEFTTVLDMAMNHSAKASKDRTGLLDGKIFAPTEETGADLMNWLKSGKGEFSQRTLQQATEPPKPKDPLEKKRAELFAVGAEHGYGDLAIKGLVAEHFPNVKSRRDLTKGQIDMLLMWIRAKPLKASAAPAAPAAPEAPPEGMPPLGSREDIASAAAESDFAPSSEEPAP